MAMSERARSRSPPAARKDEGHAMSVQMHQPSRTATPRALSDNCYQAQNDPNVETPGEKMTLSRELVSFNDKARAVLGVIQVPTDFNMDIEGPLMVSQLPGLELRMQKITFNHGSDLCKSDSFTSDPGAIQRAAGGLMPAGYLSVLGLGCTSMSFTLGPQAVDDELHKVHPNTKTTDTARSQAKAAKALGMKRVGLVTPYIDSVHANNAKMLESAGLSVSKSVNLGLIKSEYTSQVDLDTIARAVQQVDGPQVDGVIIGCTAIRVCLPGRIDMLEKAIGDKPIVTSTQAFYWNMLRTAGIDDHISGYGQLLQKH